MDVAATTDESSFESEIESNAIKFCKGNVVSSHDQGCFRIIGHIFSCDMMHEVIWLVNETYLLSH